MIHKRLLFKTPLAALTAAFLTWGASLHAQTPAPAPAPAAAPAAAAAPKPTPSLEQRVGYLEAYMSNGDPTAQLQEKDKDGNMTIPDAKKPLADALAPSNPGPGHNAWMMASAALVLFMTLPGLALFYGGLVRRKNVLSVVAQCFFCAGMVTILWVICGYSFVFADVGEAGADCSTFIGSFTKHLFLKDVTGVPNTNYAQWVSHNVFAMYQLMFAIITPALIVGSIAERMKFSAIALFITIWMFVVYFPLAHSVWGIDGAMNGVWNPKAAIKAIDFAGGTVVHMSSGWSALVLCLLLGKREGFGKVSLAPHSMVLCAIGTGMLWVGWYGFNAGSAVAADVVAAQAFTTTTIATAVASFVWPLLEYIIKGKPSILGFCSGAVAGLVVITPACGFVDVEGALIIGVAAGAVPLFFCTVVKKMFGYDDALDTFGVHAVGGTMGALLTGMLARNSANANLATNLKAYVTDSFFQPLVWEQLKAIAFTLVLAVVGTLIIGFIVKAVIGLRATPEVEDTGLDLSEHGEAGYEGA